MGSWRSKWCGVALALLIALVAAACTPDPVIPDPPEPEPGGRGVYLHAESAEPLSFDPAFADDAASERIARQIFEGLVRPDFFGTGVQPQLADTWSVDRAGRTWTFTIRSGVEFHDGTPLTPAAVCANFDRWHRWTGRAAELATVYRAHFMRAGRTLYHSCTVADDQQVQVVLHEPINNFLQLLALPQFVMQSPAALAQYEADPADPDVDPRTSPYATGNPTGTGPFTFLAHEPLVQVVLQRNPTYWGVGATLNKVVVRVVPDSQARLNELIGGRIHGFDVLQAEDFEDSDIFDVNVIDRKQASVLYLGINQHTPMLADERARRALAHAIDREALLDDVALAADTQPAYELIPPGIVGHSGLSGPEYNPALARLMLQDAGYEPEDITLRVAYPSGVTLPYLPAPEATYVRIAEQLEDVGFTVQPVAAPWPQYLELINDPERTDEHDLHLMGWSASMNHPAHLMVPLFGAQNPQFGFVQPAIHQAVNEAAADPGEVSQETWAQVSERLDDFQPVVPLAYPEPSVAIADEVRGYQISPVAAEVWNMVAVG